MLNPWYVTGFVDGEASFGLTLSKTQFQISFKINLRADDRAILDQIQQFFGCGKVYPQRRMKPDGRNGKPQFAYCITSCSDALKLIKHFDQYPLQAKKQRDYVVWREAVLCHVDGKGKHGRKREYMREFVSRLQEGRRYKDRVELSQSLFVPDAVQMRLGLS